MGMRPEIDISGLPLFYVNKIITTTMDDGNMMVVCGLQRGTEFTPLYATISPASIAAVRKGNVQVVDAAEMAGETSH